MISELDAARERAEHNYDRWAIAALIPFVEATDGAIAPNDGVDVDIKQHFF